MERTERGYIPQAAMSGDGVGVRTDGLQFGAQSFDVGIHSSFISFQRVGPQAIQELGAAEDTIGMVDKLGEQKEFVSRECSDLSGNREVFCWNHREELGTWNRLIDASKLIPG